MPMHEWCGLVTTAALLSRRTTSRRLAKTASWHAFSSRLTKLVRLERLGGKMSSNRGLIAASLMCFALAGCVTNEAIIAGAIDTVGISASGGPADQGGNLVVGFKGAKFAVVPVETEAGNLVALPDGVDKQRGFSVLALLGID